MNVANCCNPSAKTIMKCVKADSNSFTLIKNKMVKEKIIQKQTTFFFICHLKKMGTCIPTCR